MRGAGWGGDGVTQKVDSSLEAEDRGGTMRSKNDCVLPEFCYGGRTPSLAAPPPEPGVGERTD